VKHMLIRVAKSAGFCFGVRRAIDIALEAARREENVYMLGDIVHNEFVVAQIERAGIRTVQNIEDLDEGVLLLRAHGTIPEIYQEAERRRLRLVDATCPMVLDIHRIARQLEEEGYQVVIIGDQNHDEVKGIAAQVREALVVSTPLDLDQWSRRYSRVGVVVQSTQNVENVQRILARLVSFCRELRFINTICKPTTDHQNEIRSMPAENDCMIIAGSFTSANTRRLTELSAAINPRTYQVQSAADLRPLPALPPERREEHRALHPGLLQYPRQVRDCPHLRLVPFHSKPLDADMAMVHEHAISFLRQWRFARPPRRSAAENPDSRPSARRGCRSR